MWELLWFDEVDQAHLGRVFAQFEGNEVHNAFNQVGSLWTPCATIGIGRSLIGEHCIATGVGRWNVIAAIDHRQCESDSNDIGKKLEV